jgi:hypothetical protein
VEAFCGTSDGASEPPEHAARIRMANIGRARTIPRFTRTS